MLLQNGLLNICTNHLCGPFRTTNRCLWLISCLKVFEIVVCYGAVKPGRLCRTRTVVFRGVLRQFTYLRNRRQHSFDNSIRWRTFELRASPFELQQASYNYYLATFLLHWSSWPQSQRNLLTVLVYSTAPRTYIPSSAAWNTGAEDMHSFR